MKTERCNLNLKNKAKNDHFVFIMVVLFVIILAIFSACGSEQGKFGADLEAPAKKQDVPPESPVDLNATLRNLSEIVTQIVQSDTLKSFKFPTVQFANIDGKSKNIVVGTCSNRLWPETRAMFEAPLKDEVPCWDFDQSTGYVPENLGSFGNLIEIVRCWLGGDCGYFTWLGWYFDFQFPSPTFSVSGSNVIVSIDTATQQISVDYAIDNLFIEAPESMVRWKHWYTSREGIRRGWDNLGPPAYPNAWMYCCEAVIWPNGEEWNPFYHSLSLNNLGATLILNYEIDLSSGNLSIYLNQFTLKTPDASDVSYTLDNVWPAGSPGDEYVEPAIQRGFNKLLFNKINEYIDAFNQHYGNPPPLTLLKSAQTNTPLNTQTRLLDIDFGPYLQKIGEALEQGGEFQDDLKDIIDRDEDWVSDWDEVNVYGTDPSNQDTDQDGLTDGREVYMYNTDPLDTDTDDDGLTDFREIEMGTNPQQKDNPAVMIIVQYLLEDDETPAAPAPELPDLAITNVDIQGRTAFVTITNMGNAVIPARPYYYLQWGYDANSGKGYSYGLAANFTYLCSGPLAPGEFIVVKAMFGDFGAGFSINHPAEVEESDYTNNCVDIDGNRIDCPVDCPIL